MMTARRLRERQIAFRNLCPVSRRQVNLRRTIGWHSHIELKDSLFHPPSHRIPAQGRIQHRLGVRQAATRMRMDENPLIAGLRRIGG